MTWKVITPEQLATLPAFRGLTLIGVRYGDGYIEYLWSSPPRSEEHMRAMKEEGEAEIRKINGVPPDAPLH